MKIKIINNDPAHLQGGINHIIGQTFETLPDSTWDHEESQEMKRIGEIGIMIDDEILIINKAEYEIIKGDEEMIYVTKEKWNSIPKEYKGKWDKSIKENGWQPDLPDEFIGNRNVLSGCISDEIGSLLTENIHFKIIA